MIRIAAAIFSGAIIVGAASTAPIAPGSRCRLVLTKGEHELVRTPLFGNEVNVNYDAGGRVHLKCLNQKVFLDADSVSVISQDYARMYGHVVYRDTMYRFAADTMMYDLKKEMLHAGGNVDILDSAAGSTLKGPYVDYYRQVKGVNDSARIDAFKRPTVRYFTKRAAGDTAHQSPYVIVAAHLRGFGQSKMTADSAVTLDRDSVHAIGDSIAVDRGKLGLAQIFGKPGKLRRAGSDSFSVTGWEIRFRLEDDKLREIRSFLDAQVVRGPTAIAGDTVLMTFTAEKLALTLAWNHKTGATIHSDGYDVVGDSVAVETPLEQLREIRVYGHGAIQNPVDSSLRTPVRYPGDTARLDTTRNTLAGERVLAHFDQIDSAGTKVTRIRGLEAYGRGPLQARSYYARMVSGKDGRTSPSINYTRADTILMTMKGGDSSGIAVVNARGKVDGVQAEALSVKKPKPDSTKPLPGTGRP